MLNASAAVLSAPRATSLSQVLVKRQLFFDFAFKLCLTWGGGRPSAFLCPLPCEAPCVVTLAALASAAIHDAAALDAAAVAPDAVALVAVALI